MKMKLLTKKEQEKPMVTNQAIQEKKPVKEEPVEQIKNEKRTLEIPGFQQLKALAKLRLAITIIFLLSTLAILLVFITDFVIAAIIILISYVLLFLLMIKLFMIKKL